MEVALNRRERRGAAKNSRTLARQRPIALKPVPVEQWPEGLQSADAIRVAVWVSREHLVQVFQEMPIPLPEPIALVRLTVSRTTLDKGGRFDDGITWEQMQDIKRRVGYANHYAVEIYPRQIDVVNVANLRHLWVLEHPLPIGWFNQYA